MSWVCLRASPPSFLFIPASENRIKQFHQSALTAILDAGSFSWPQLDQAPPDKVLELIKAFCLSSPVPVVFNRIGGAVVHHTQPYIDFSDGLDAHKDNSQNARVAEPLERQKDCVPPYSTTNFEECVRK